MKATLSLVITSLLCMAAHAFPPAPHYTLYGMVRDQVGQTIQADGAMVVLLKGGTEVGRASIATISGLDHNYELTVRLDHNRSGTTLYNSKALAAQGPFSLAVDMNGSRFYPIEVTGTLTAGRGGDRVRLDLNLGEDSDGDGLPDIWEQWQLYQAGYFPDENGLWPIHLLHRDGDFDHDGLSDWMEYVAGTFAGDATETFGLEIKEKTASSVRFEFFAIIGKAYTIERSTDARMWSAVPFALGAPGSGQILHTATTVSIVSAFATPSPAGQREFFRLTVR
jgi:hypothetical protein